MQTAARTIEYSFFKWHWLPMSTGATGLTRVGRVDSDELVTSLCRFVTQLIKERRPRRVLNAFRQTMIVYHPVDVEVFHCDETELVNDPTGMLVSEVLAFPFGTLMHPSNDFPFMVSLTGALLSFGEVTLGFGQSLLFVAKKSRFFNFLAIGKSRKGFESDVNTYLSRIVRQFLRLIVAREAHVPLPCGGSGDSTSLRSPLHWSVKSNLDVPNLGEDKLATLDGTARWDLRKGDAIVPAFTLKSGISRFLTCLQSSKESFHSQVDTNGYILEDLRMDSFKRRTFLLQYLERIDLLIARKALACLLVDGFASLKQMVIEPAALFKRLVKQSLLFLRWEDSVLKHFMHMNILA